LSFANFQKDDRKNPATVLPITRRMLAIISPASIKGSYAVYHSAIVYFYNFEFNTLFLYFIWENFIEVLQLNFVEFFVCLEMSICCFSGAC
jgi:hypothetical protein